MMKVILALSIIILLFVSVDAATINLVYLHGVQACTADRQSAHLRLQDLKNSLQTALAGSGHTFTHTLANLYTEPASSCAPSNSEGPLNMDDWEVGQGCGSVYSGDRGTTAYEWRYRLANLINRLPGNVVLIGHSTGARTAVEVAANVGTSGQPLSYDWGVQSKILGVVTVHGMIADLSNSKYNPAGPFSFMLECKKGDIAFIGPNVCANGNGWCEYGGLNSGVAANDWVAKNRFVLNLVSYTDCSPDIWRGFSDGALPVDSQSSPAAPGLIMTDITGDEDFTPANGMTYGSFCHSAITTASYSNHGEAVSSATTKIKQWLLTAAPRLVRYGFSSTNALGYMTSSPSYMIPPGCPSGFDDGSIHVAGYCDHPALLDGDDHIIGNNELLVTDGQVCDGTYQWSQMHDSKRTHAATIYFKSHANKRGGVASTAI